MSAVVGRPRDPAIDAAVLAATVALLREGGYAGFALEKAAARAGTTKAAIRRRWPVRQRLVIDALATVLVTPLVPDNDCTRCDLHQSVRLLAEALDEGLPPGVLAPLVADCAADPELHRALVETLVQPSRGAAAVAVRRAICRGDLRPDVDPDLFVDLLASVVYQRALFGGAPVDPASARRLVDLLLRGVAVDFDHLVRISEQPREDRRHRH
ncbi:MAG: TetR/AcrR family transcriptional regulator C-terminal ligand-binding domain-containing protein [Actinomycetia bacterium]|nr:TetR/AcrR family transcriptional regulator C-terminal ligand-binding domain-containing protein [Actinomycetes bacterium]MCL2733774.1 TetR/AcrR family transcriptional regulator C-terminal ligand-binding domain-containing protein [Actinomycetes bacterium]